jgi:hypothetical protein
MRTLLASVCALALLVPACTTETDTPSGPTTSTQPKTSKTKRTTPTSGEHGTAPPADDPTGTTPPPADGAAITVTSWDGAQSIAANSYIPAGQTLTINPGAVVTIASGVSLTVKGTLKVAAASNHAKLTGTGWTNLFIAQGGTLDADGLDISGAKAAIHTATGNTKADLKDSVIAADSPFDMEAGSVLTVTNSQVTANSAGSTIAGNFTMTNVQYNKGSNPGLTLSDAAGTMTILNSTLTGGGTQDYVISDTGHQVTVKQTSISGSHCAFHFDSVDSFTIDHVEEANNGVGAMFFGSGTGPNTVTASNFRDNSEQDLEFGSNKNGTITFDGSFVKVPAGSPANIQTTNPSTTPIASAGPTTATQ